jgi:hypothetical protein
MKALPMLDHVCLWIARVFLVVLLWPLILFQILDCLTILENWLQLDPKDYVPVPGSFLFALASLWLILWFLCTKHLQSVITRSCLGLCSRATLVLLTYGIFDQFFISHPIVDDSLSNEIASILIMLLAEIGFGSMLWAAVRPPKHDKTSTSGFILSSGRLRPC